MRIYVRFVKLINELMWLLIAIISFIVKIASKILVTVSNAPKLSLRKKKFKIDRN